VPRYKRETHRGGKDRTRGDHHRVLPLNDRKIKGKKVARGKGNQKGTSKPQESYDGTMPGIFLKKKEKSGTFMKEVKQRGDKRTPETRKRRLHSSFRNARKLFIRGARGEIGTKA